MTLNFPSLKVFVLPFYLYGPSTRDLKKELEEAYLIALKVVEGQPIFATVHLKSGAVYSKLPLQAIYCDKFHTVSPSVFYDLNELQPWSCLSKPQLVIYKHLNNYHVQVRMSDKKVVWGHYLATIDYHGTQGLSDDPEQYKTHNLVVLHNGQIGAFPNNHMVFDDKYFTEIQDWPKYKRQTKRYFAE